MNSNSHSVARTPGLRRSGFVALAGVAILAACAAPPPPEPEPEPIDVEQESLRTELATRLETPRRIDFDWRVQQQDLRLSGSGVARVEPPYRARLDLFLGNGERAAAAALVDGDLRLPPGLASGIIPPPHLLWGTLGVFRPGLNVALLGGETIDGLFRIRYRLDDGAEVHYYLQGRNVMRVDLLRGGSVVEDVRLRRDGTGTPAEAVYRDLTAFRQLTITRTGVEHVEPYPPDIWRPGPGGDRPAPGPDGLDDRL